MRLMAISLVLLLCCSAPAQEPYIDTTYDYWSTQPALTWPCYGYGFSRVPWESIPNYDIRGNQMRLWALNAQLHAVRKSQFMSQYAAQSAGIPGLVAFKRSRSQVRRSMLAAGYNPWSRPIKKYAPYRPELDNAGELQ